MKINGERKKYTGDPEMPLLWYLRDEAGLKGTKFGCGIAQCGACTVHIDGQAMRACSVQMADVSDAEIKRLNPWRSTESFIRSSKPG